MKLFYSLTSPYARKVRVTLAECGIDSVELNICNPFEQDSAIGEDNPLGKVPALIVDDGELIVDSPVICEFLDQYQRMPTLVPTAPAERIKVLRDQALADGVIDLAVGHFLEELRPQAQRSAERQARARSAIDRALRYLEHRAASPSAPLDLGTIALGCALGYLDFRLPMLQWRAKHPKLDALHDTLSARPSFTQTTPPA